MNLPAEVTEFAQVAVGKRSLHIAIGIFDGVHLGHQAVIDTAKRLAQGDGGVCGVLTFDPHPSRFFRPENATRLIMPLPIKVHFLHQLGVDLVIRKTFDATLAEIEAGAFLGSIKEELPSLESVHVGENFQFGKGRSGDVSVLVESGRACGVRVFSVERVRIDGAPISSTRIRGAIEAGRLDEASQLLGYTYFSEGKVQSGQGKGRTIGFPTLNLRWSPELYPPYGVYIVKANGVPAVANYGVRPTVDDGDLEPWLEVHLLEESKVAELDRAEKVRVEWLSFLRSEQRFPDFEALKMQIAVDVEIARSWFA